MVSYLGHPGLSERDLPGGGAAWLLPGCWLGAVLPLTACLCKMDVF